MKVDKQNFIFYIFFQFYEFLNQFFNEESTFSVTKISKYPFRVTCEQINEKEGKTMKKEKIKGL